MSELPESSEEFKKLIKKMEEMLKGRSTYYFDVDEIIEGSEHFLEENKIKQAREVLEIGQSLHPLSSEIMVQYAQVLCMQEKFNQALELIAKAEDIEPNNKDFLLIKAEIYSGQEKHKEAIECLWEFINTSDDKDFLDVVYNDLAWEYETLNDHENALKCLQEAIKIDPSDDSLLFEIAYFYEALEKREESIKYYESYIDEHPYSYNAWYNLGNIYNDIELYEKAVEAFDFAIVIKDDFASAYFNKGNAYFKLGRYQEAIDCYLSTFEFEENQAITYCYLGECYEKLKQLEESEKCFQFALEIDPKITDGLIGMTIVRDLQGRTIEGLPYIEQATKLYPNHFESWYIKGEVNEKLEEFEEARTCYQKAFEINPDNEQMLLTYSNFIAEQDSVDKALDFLGESDSNLIKYRKVAFLIMLGKQQEALSLLEDALTENPENYSLLERYHPDIKELVDFVTVVRRYKK